MLNIAGKEKESEMMEDIKQMRKRHIEEIQALQVGCVHNMVSECMPFAWAPGHISHCVKVCMWCGKELATTRSTYTYRTPLREFFTCPKREDCFYTGSR